MNTTNNPIIQLIKASLFNKSEIFLTIFICLLAYLFIGIFPQKVAGDTVSDTNYSIDVGNVDTNPQPTPKSKVLGINNFQTPQPKEFTTGTNYTVTTNSDTLSLALSQDNIDYGILSSTNPVIRTSGITIANGGLGAEVLGYENAPPSGQNAIIENTTCDNGSCSTEIAAPWTNTLTYGFGYRCDSLSKNACDSQFSQSNYFKQYASTALSQSPEPIVVSDEGQTKATITYKVNISGTQKTGGYYNSITYLAIPNF